MPAERRRATKPSTGGAADRDNGRRGSEPERSAPDRAARVPERERPARDRGGRADGVKRDDDQRIVLLLPGLVVGILGLLPAARPSVEGRGRPDRPQEVRDLVRGRISVTGEDERDRPIMADTQVNKPDLLIKRNPVQTHNPTRGHQDGCVRGGGDTSPSPALRKALLSGTDSNRKRRRREVGAPSDDA